MSELDDISTLEGLSVSIIRDAYNRGRVSVYGELIDECTSNSRTRAAVWLLEKLVAEIYAAPNLSPESLAFVEEMRARLEVLKGSEGG